MVCKYLTSFIYFSKLSIRNIYSLKYFAILERKRNRVWNGIAFFKSKTSIARESNKIHSFAIQKLIFPFLILWIGVPNNAFFIIQGHVQDFGGRLGLEIVADRTVIPWVAKRLVYQLGGKRFSKEKMILKRNSN